MTANTSLLPEYLAILAWRLCSVRRPSAGFGKEGTEVKRLHFRRGMWFLPAVLLVACGVLLGSMTGASADPIAYWKGPLGSVEVYKGSGLAKLVINPPGKTYTVEAPERYYGGSTLAAGTVWEIYWPRPHAADFTDLSMSIMDVDVMVDQIADADTVWNRIAHELGDPTILDLYGVPTLRATYAHPDTLYTGDVFDTTSVLGRAGRRS